MEGVKLAGQVDKKIRFLRRIPKDPFTNSTEWGMRSTQDDPKSNSWGGQNVFDVYTQDHGEGTGWHAVFGVVDAAGETRRRALAAGFTLIELMIVMTIVVILVSIAVPLYQKSIMRAKESVLKNNLFTMRTVIDEYTYDKQKAPQTLAGPGERGLPARRARGSDDRQQHLLAGHHGGRHAERQPDRAGDLRREERIG